MLVLFIITVVLGLGAGVLEGWVDWRSPYKQPMHPLVFMVLGATLVGALVEAGAMGWLGS